MTERLPVKIHPAVFNLKDSKVETLLHAGMSVTAFSLLIQPNDPYILIGNTIYAYTEQEFYALRAARTVNTFTDTAFDYVLKLEDLSFMSEHDKLFMDQVKADMPRCTVCKYRRYRDEVSLLVKKYGIEIPGDKKQDDMEFKAVYPETTGEIPALVFQLTNHMYSLPKTTRIPCMDCVEKHISQAWVLSKECLQGYPEHITYVIGHLGEAIDEMPRELTAFRQTLEYCLAKTTVMRIPFIPIGALEGHIAMGRMDNTEDKGSTKIDAENTKLELAITNGMVDEINHSPISVLQQLLDKLQLISNIKDYKEQDDRLLWLGNMANAADMIVDYAPLTANMIRARRLVFVESPELMSDAGYSMMDLYMQIQSRINKNTGNTAG